MTMKDHSIFKPGPSVKNTVLKVSPNGRYLSDQYGKPFFYLGDTAWTLFKRLNHEDMDYYFNNRISKGFTVIQTYFLRGLNVKNLYGHLPLIDHDPETPNNEFYKYVDYAVNRANELGLVIAGVVCWGVHVEASYGNDIFKEEQVFNKENAYIHGEFLGSRYKNNCVIWYLGGDKEPLNNEDVWEAMARGLKKGSENRHLVSYHVPGTSGGIPSSSVGLHKKDWLDFNVLQTGHGWTVNNYKYIAHDYSLIPPKPTFDMEASYENHKDVSQIVNRRIDDHQVRESMYWQVLAGAAGHGYGCNDIWCFWDEADAVRDYSFPAVFHQNTYWKVALDFPGASGVGYARKIFELRPWYQLVPDQSIIAGGQGEGENHAQAARSIDGSFILVYLTFGNPISIRMDMLASRKVKAQWYNPRDGRFMSIGQYTNAGVEVFTAPTNYDKDDWVLVLEDEVKNYPV